MPLTEKGQSPAKKKFKAYPIGYLPVDVAEVQTEQGRVSLFGAVDRTSKVAFAELQPRATRMLAAELLRRALQALPCKAHTVLTDNGVQFTLQAPQWFAGGYRFDRVCRAFSVEHRRTKPAHPWTSGQVERLNRTLKEATVLRYHYETTEQLNEHLQAFLLAYHHTKRLKTLRGLTPHEFVCAQHQKNPPIFTRDHTYPAHPGTIQLRECSSPNGFSFQSQLDAQRVVWLPLIINRASWGAAAPIVSRGYERIEGSPCVHYNTIVLHHSGTRINYPTMHQAQALSMKQGIVC